MKTQKTEKLKRSRYYGINITLQSKIRKGPDVYKSLVETLYSEQHYSNIGSEITLAIRTMFNGKVSTRDTGDIDILYGRLIRFNQITNWYNKDKDVLQDYVLPEGLVPNMFETEYIFIPAFHRFFIKYNNKINVTQVKKFLEKSLQTIVPVEEIVSVNVMASSDEIAAIQRSKSIKRLEIEVSYSNSDLGSDAKELIDNLFKSSHSGKATIVLNPDANGSLDQNSDLVKGLLELSKDNGYAKATIVDEFNKQKTIDTGEIPEKIPVEFLESDESGRQALVIRMAERFIKSQN